MKKLVLGLFLTFAALTLLLSPALAETKEPQAARTLSAADRAFLASLARMPIAPAPAAKRPGDDPPIGENALCSATAYCWDGTTRSCQGNNSTTSCTAVDSNCPGQRGYVTCDGATTYCPTCPPGECGEDWCQDEDNCASSCYPCDYTYTCNPTYCTDRCRCIFSTCPI
jgi:hypothetical protein